MLTQWDNAANLPLTPRTIRRGWWRCEKGHHWQSVLYRRTEGAQCPYCAGRAAWPGDNDLATYSLELTKEWHLVENLPLTPNQVLPGSHKIVWWVHREGHEWRAQVKSRTSGHGCPVCANREILPGDNDLASRFPELTREWHPTKNGPITPPPGLSWFEA